MRVRLSFHLLLLGLVLAATGCGPQKQFYWGSYEDSLFSRQQQPGAEGEVKAASMLTTVMRDAEASGMQHVGPGIHADYGYLLFKQGRYEEAIAELQREASLYPESRLLMNTMISRIQARSNSEKKPVP